MNIHIVYWRGSTELGGIELSDLRINYNLASEMDLIIVHNDKQFVTLRDRMGNSKKQLFREDMLTEFVAQWIDDWRMSNPPEPDQEDDTTDWGIENQTIGG